MKNVIVEVLKLEAVAKRIDGATSGDQVADHQLREAVSAIFDSLDLLKERAGLSDDGWRDAA